MWRDTRGYNHGTSWHLYGDAMFVPIRMDTNMAAGNQQKHLSLSFATKGQIYLSVFSCSYTSLK